MSDLVERVARAIYEEDDPWHKAWPWPDLQSDQAGVDQYRRIAEAAIAAMQTDAEPVAYWYRHPTQMDAEPFGTLRLTDADKADGWTETPLYAHPPVAAPALKPAVEVWREASDAATDGSVKYQSHADQAAAAVIEADRAAIIAAKDAEIAALKGQLAQQAEDNADLPTIAYFAGAADARDRLAALQAHADALAGALGVIASAETTHIRVNEGRIGQWTGSLQSYADQALRAYDEFRRVG